MTFILALLLNVANAADRVDSYGSTLRHLNFLFYADHRVSREKNELTLYETLPRIAEFYARLEMPELAYYYQRRALESARVAEKFHQTTLDNVLKLERRSIELHRETKELVSRREEIERSDAARVVQLFLSVQNRVLDLRSDEEPLVLGDKIREGFQAALLRLQEPLDEGTIAALFAAVSNPNYDAELRLASLVYLARTNRPELLPMLVHFASQRDSSTDLARAALTSLDQFSERTLTVPLARIVENQRAPTWARQLAAERLGNFDEHVTRAVLENVAWRELGGDWALGLSALQSLEKVGNVDTLERLRQRFEHGFESPRKTDAVKASLIALAARLKVDCDDLLKKKN